jgi:hypothetical protein
MAFTTTELTLVERRAKLREVQQLVQELIQLNETAARTWTQLTAQGASAEEIKNTLDKILAAGGDAYQVAATDPVAFVGDTISDRIISILVPIASGTSWVHSET